MFGCRRRTVAPERNGTKWSRRIGFRDFLWYDRQRVFLKSGREEPLYNIHFNNQPI
jgi:hypothetical protein